MEQQIEAVRDLFHRRFVGEPRVFRAPGRVNLIGEHTDYNGGFVLPVAIHLQTVVACASRSDRRFAVYAADKGEAFEFDLDDVAAEGSSGSWQRYVEGTIRTIDAKQRLHHGADVIFSSTVPIGAGMSSSAALEVGIGFSVSAINDIRINLLDLAQAGQSAEHNFVGTRSGIMDQYASAFGRQGHAILLDCRDLSTSFIQLDLPESSFVVCDSGVQHELASSEYNRRREECEQAVEVLNRSDPQIHQLRDVTFDDLNRCGGQLSDVQLKRARHVVCENHRTVEAARYLSARNLQRFGEMMFESHASLREDFEVSCAELDLLVDTASRVEGVLGSRMMGGGFGGSTISLVSDRAKDRFYEELSRDYLRQFGRVPAFYDVRSADGVSEVILS